MTQIDVLSREEFACQMERLRDLRGRQAALNPDERAELWRLSAQLAATEVRLQGTAEQDVLDVGARVTLRDVISGRELQVQLVPDLDPVWARSGTVMVSRDSPTGRMLIGRKAGDHFTVTGGRHNTELVYEIVAHQTSVPT